MYNSNAIENSSLTLEETENILHDKIIPTGHSQREFLEAVNLSHVIDQLNKNISKKASLDKKLILNAHKELLHAINNSIAGRFRQANEYVRVGHHIAPPPDRVERLMKKLLSTYHTESPHVLQRIAMFHLAFEFIHPFCDGNGRVGRAIMNFQLKSHGYPPIIIRNKGKHRYYYSAFKKYEFNRETKNFEHVFALLLKESLHKRITYLREDEIMYVSYIEKKQSDRSQQSISNAAKNNHFLHSVNEDDGRLA